MKICKKCNLFKNKDEFHNHVSNKDGLCTLCKDCYAKRSLNYYHNNKSKADQYQKNNKEKIKTYRKAYYIKTKEQRKEYALKNKKRIKIVRDAYNEKNKDNIRIKRRKYESLKYKKDIQYRIAKNYRSRIHDLLKRKDNKTVYYLGCSIKELMIHLEKQFYNNKETDEVMSWDNYGSKGWHIDHIRGLINFNLEDDEQLKIAFHYTNTQPLWAKENLSKKKRCI